MTHLAYVLAASHSGSTLLSMLLGAQPEAVTVGELKATGLGDRDLYRCSCRAPIQECRFWKTISEQMRLRGFVFDITAAGTSIQSVENSFIRTVLTPRVRGIRYEVIRDCILWMSREWHVHLRRTQERNVALPEALVDLTGARVVVDSSKRALRLKYLLRNPGLDIKVVRLLRDGRAVALTYMQPSLFADASDATLRGGGSGKHSERSVMSMQCAARSWRRNVQEADDLLAGLGRSRWLEVRYEQLCVRPQETLQEVCRFLTLDPERVVLDFRSVEQHVIGNGMRFDTASDIRLDERWRTSLSKEDLAAFNDEAGDLNRRYGYD